MPQLIWINKGGVGIVTAQLMFSGEGLTSSGFVFEVNSFAVRDWATVLGMLITNQTCIEKIVWMFFHYLVISLARH